MLREAEPAPAPRFGFVVWLTADPAELARRLEADRRGLAERPALTPAGTLDEIAQVLEARRRSTRGWPTPMIETGGKSPGEVADAILGCWTP